MRSDSFRKSPPVLTYRILEWLVQWPAIWLVARADRLLQLLQHHNLNCTILIERHELTQ